MAKIYLKKITSIPGMCVNKNFENCFYHKTKYDSFTPCSFKHECSNPDIIYKQIFPKVILKKVEANDTCIKLNDFCKNDSLKLECYFINNCRGKPERFFDICANQGIIFVQVFPENNS